MLADIVVHLLSWQAIFGVVKNVDCNENVTAYARTLRPNRFMGTTQVLMSRQKVVY